MTTTYQSRGADAVEPRHQASPTARVLAELQMQDWTPHQTSATPAPARW